jgi:hypothetical protein
MSMGLAQVVVGSLIPLVRQAADESGPSGDLVTAGPAAELGRDAAALEPRTRVAAKSRHPGSRHGVLKSALGL